jgi:DNA-binding NtrC family response regulator
MALQTTPLTGLGILILEDEVLLRKQIVAMLERLGMEVTAVGQVQAARQMAAELNFDFALLDVNLPDGLGTDLLRERVFTANTSVIVMTANGGVQGAVEAMKLGAVDYLVKPFDPAELLLVLNRVRGNRQKARVDEHRQGDEKVDGFFFGSALTGLETQLNRILAADRRVVNHLPPVLIEGETGSGKTTIARWLHQRGPRAEQPLIEVNCSALPETLAESELFGHERGAFTDARSARMGLFEAANGGTLFLDELPSLSAGLQAKVLTAIEDHKVRRVGGNKPIEVDVRLITATNKDLKQAIAAGQFREDLYHRLDLFRIQIPALRDRGEDVVSLAERLVEKLSRRHRLPLKQITPAGRQRLRSYRWPGNVRELAHELERAIVFEDSPALEFQQLMGGGAQPQQTALSPQDWFNPAFRFEEGDFSMDEAINRVIQHALKQVEGNVSAAARLLGVTRDYIRYRLEPAKQNGESTGE